MKQAEYQHALPTGTRLDTYEIESVIGSGGFGITYKARDTQLNHLVAIKEYLPVQLAWRTDSTQVVPKSEADTESYAYGLQQFIEEGRALALFKHPNIVRVVRYFQANGTAYLVMEYEQGMSFKDYLRENPKPDEHYLLSLLLALLDGLQAIHAQKYLHRDIKPGNIYIREQGDPVLLDFGSARQALTQQSQSFTRIVTAGYAPFEQYPGNIKQTPATDLYALGATLYRAVTGKVPVNALQRFNDLQIDNRDPLVPAVEAGASMYSKAFLKLIDWMIQVYPQHRPQSTAQITALLSVEQGEQPSTRINPDFDYQPQRTGRGKRSVSTGLILAAAGALFAVIAASLYLVYEYQPPGKKQDTTTTTTGRQPSQAETRSPQRDRQAFKPMEVIKGPTQFVFNTRPRGAKVYLNKQYKGTTPLITGPINAGTYIVKLEKQGYKPYSSAILLMEGFTYKINRKLRPDNLYKLVIKPTPAGSRIEFLQPKLRYRDDLYVKPGKYRVRLSAPNHRSRTLDLAISYTDRTFNIVLKHQQLIKTVPFKSFIRRLAVSDATRSLLVDSASEGIFLLDLNTGKIRRKFPRSFHNTLSVSHDGQLALLNEFAASYVIDLRTGTRLNTIKSKCRDRFAWSPVARQFACSYGNTVEVRDAISGARLKSFTLPDSIELFAYAPDGNRALMLSSSDQKNLKVISMDNGKTMQTLQGFDWEFLAAVFTPDGKKIFTATDDKKLRLWDLQTAKPVLTINTDSNIVTNQVAVSADGKRALSVGVDHTVLYWDLKTGKKLAQFSGHTDLVNSIAFFDHDRKILSAGHDKTVRFWVLPLTQTATHR